MDALERAKELYSKYDFSNFAIVEKPKCYTMGNGSMHMQVVFETEEVEVLQGRCDPGCRVQPHIHEQDENILCYQGEAMVTVAGNKHHLTSGATVSIPAGTIHYTTSDAGCKVLVARHPPCTEVY